MSHATRTAALVIAVSLSMSAAQASGLSHLSGHPVRAAQLQLADLGYDVGPRDGVVGVQTSAALADFQYRSGLVITGTLNAETAEMLKLTYVSARREYGNWEHYVAPRRYNNYGATYPVTASLVGY